MTLNVTVTGDITVDWIQWPVKEDADVSRFNWKSHLGFKEKPSGRSSSSCRHAEYVPKG